MSVLPLTFGPLPLGTIKPLGWLRQQLELMTDGLPGHMHEFYRLVSNATWSGGDQEYSALNEAWPYYINGLVPLAYALDDQRLLGALQEQIQLVLLKQFPDGWLGPEMETKSRNFWGRYPFFLAAAQYVEAADPLESANMVRAMHHFVDLMHEMLKQDYQGYVWKEGDNFDEQWGRSRAADMVMVLQWLFEHHPENDHDKIYECMIMLYEKAFDWSWWFEDENFLKDDVASYPPDLVDPLFPFLHVVNVAQGLKSPAVMGRLVHDTKLFDSSRRGVDLILEYKGTPSGAVYGDERMSNNSPKRGTELCSVVEEMFSLSTLYQILGDASFADRLELVAFNALPAMVTSDWWAHQYIAQTNQPCSYEVVDPPFFNVCPLGITFGLEPNYPCCTVNFPQGYPKLLANSWVHTPEHNGLAHVVLLPSDVTTTVETINGRGGTVQNNVHIKCTTNYPFAHELMYKIDIEHALNFSFRVPAWADLDNEMTYVELVGNTQADQADSRSQKPLGSPQTSSIQQRLQPNSHSALHTILVPPGESTYHVSFAAKQPASDQNTATCAPGARPATLQRPIVQSRPNSAISLSHGALLFAHSPPSESFSRRPQNYPNPNDAPPQANDWTIVPRSVEAVPWNIAIDPTTAVVHTTPDEDGLSQPPLVSISVLACKIEWNMTRPVEYRNDGEDGQRTAVKGGVPLDPPLPTKGPKTGKMGHKCMGRAFMVELKPYGSTKIRIAEFPVVNLSSGSGDLEDRDQ